MKYLILSILYNIILINFVKAYNHAETLFLQHTKSHEELHTQGGKHLNIHMIPHSHCDMGWLKTVDSYLYGGLRDNQWNWGNVTQILNSVVSELASDENKKFIWAEQGFFSRWYQESSQIVQEMVQKIVKNEQLTFQGGGWVVNDEACPYYEDIIDQIGVGHQFLKDFFDFTPTVGWQQDPFGHSQANAYLQTQFGFDSLMMSRIDYQEQLIIQEDMGLQFLWELPLDNFLMTTVFYYRYTGPQNFDYDYRGSRNKPTPSKEQSIKFLSYLRNTSYHYTSEEFCHPLGDDFTYGDAHYSFKNYDKYFQNINENSQTLHSTIQYTNPDKYMKILNNKVNEFKAYKKNDDFYPYRDTTSDYWTGYFTTKPIIKKFTRDNGQYLQKIRNFINQQFLIYQHADYFQNQLLDKNSTLTFGFIQNQLLKFEQEVATLQHHDAVTGTNEEHVLEDYFTRTNKAKENVVNIIQQIINIRAEQSLKQNINNNNQNQENIINFNFQYCAKNNYISEDCMLPKQILENDKFILNIYNHDQTEETDKFTVVKVNIPIKNLENYKIIDSNGSLINGEIISSSILHLKENQKNIQIYALYIKINLTPLNDNYLQFIKVENKEESSIKYIEKQIFTGNEATIRLGKKSIVIERDSRIIVYQDHKVQKQFTLNYIAYNDSQESNFKRTSGKSGPYIFVCKNENDEASIFSDYLQDKNIPLEITQGDIVSYIGYQGKITTELFLIQGQHFIDIKTDIQLQGSEKVEVALRLEFQQVFNDNKFYTDSNGLFRIQRQLGKWNNYSFESDSNNEVSGNYYPITRFISINDTNSRITLFNDRTQGGTSLKEGQIEVMINRQTSSGDNKGINSGLSDTRRYIMDHYLVFNKDEDQERLIQRQLDLQPEIYYTQIQNLQQNLQFDINLFNIQRFQEINLPRQVKYYVKYMYNNKILIRIQNILETQQIDLNLINFFQEFEEIEETNLQGTRNICEIKENKLLWKVKNFQKNNKMSWENQKCEPTPNLQQITFKPLEFRTFIFKNPQSQNVSNNLSQLQLWDRNDSKRQQQCSQDCTENGVCVLSKCICFKGKGSDCKDSCEVKNCQMCNYNKCDRCQEGYQLTYEKTCQIDKDYQQNNQIDIGCQQDLEFQIFNYKTNQHECQQCSEIQQCLLCEKVGCKQCQKGYYIQNNQCKQCKNECIDCIQYEVCSEPKENTFFNIQKKSFQFCQKNCLKCQNENSCTQCDEQKGFYLQQNDQNYSICVTDTQCSAFCQKCISPQECFQCQEGYILNKSGIKLCSACEINIPNCEQCDNQKGICNKCFKGYYLDNQKNTQTCEPCAQGCKDCQNNTSCKECSFEQFYFNTSYLKCVNCNEIFNCKACDINGCLECQDKYFINSGKCFNCSVNCLKCTNIQTCDQCIENYIFDEKSKDCVKNNTNQVSNKKQFDGINKKFENSDGEADLLDKEDTMIQQFLYSVLVFVILGLVISPIFLILRRQYAKYFQQNVEQQQMVQLPNDINDQNSDSQSF